MTEELSALITALTCPHCNGGGTLAHRNAKDRAHALAGMYVQGLICCHTCEGDGLSPQGKELSHAHLNAN